jgi:hypothetical protein
MYVGFADTTVPVSIPPLSARRASVGVADWRDQVHCPAEAGNASSTDLRNIPRGKAISSVSDDGASSKNVASSQRLRRVQAASASASSSTATLPAIEEPVETDAALGTSESGGLHRDHSTERDLRSILGEKSVEELM